MSSRRDHVELERRRRRAARLFEKGVGPAEVARRLKVARQAAYVWKQAWESGGLEALSSKGPAGPKAKLSASQIQQLCDALLEGPVARGYRTELWTCSRVALLIRDLTGVKYHPGHVWKLLGALGFSCQRPTRRAIERDEKKISHWKRVAWPDIKKKPNASGAPSFSLTRRA
jgi:transposase